MSLVFNQAPLLMLDYKWSHNLPSHRGTVTPNWYWTHTVPKFGLQSSWTAVHAITPGLASDLFYLLQFFVWLKLAIFSPRAWVIFRTCFKTRKSRDDAYATLTNDLPLKTKKYACPKQLKQSFLFMILSKSFHTTQTIMSLILDKQWYEHLIKTQRRQLHFDS